MATRRKPGRHPKITPDVTERIYAALRGGNYREVAAQWAGISPSTMREWMRKGHPRNRAKANAPYVEFRRQVHEAEQAAEIAQVALVMKAAKDDARHAQWWLERKMPERWGRKEQVRVGNVEGETLRVDKGTDEAALLAKLRRMAGNDGGGTPPAAPAP